MVESRVKALHAAKPDEVFWGIIDRFHELSPAEQMFLFRNMVRTTSS
jgi:hypothetical protein